MSLGFPVTTLKLLSFPPTNMMMNESAAAGRSYYEILGVGEHATEKEIRKAYKGLALKLHPDKQKNEHDKKEVNDKFTTMQNAYEVLIDPVQRQQYNLKLEALRAKSKRTTTGRDSYYYTRSHQGQQESERSDYHGENRQNNDYSYRRENNQETKQNNRSSSRGYRRQSGTEQSSPPHSSSYYSKARPSSTAGPSCSSDNHNGYSSYNNTWSSSTAGGASSSSNNWYGSSYYHDKSSSTAGASSSSSSQHGYYSSYNHTWSSSKAGTSSRHRTRYSTPNDAKKTKYRASEHSSSTSSNHKRHHHSSSQTNHQRSTGTNHPNVFGYRADGEPCRRCMKQGCFCYQHKEQDPTFFKTKKSSQYPGKAETKTKNHHHRSSCSHDYDANNKVYGRRKSDGQPCMRCVKQGGYCFQHKDQEQHQKDKKARNNNKPEPQCHGRHSCQEDEGRVVYGIRAANGKPCLRCMKQRRFCHQHVHQQQQQQQTQ